MFGPTFIVALAAICELARAHTVITYPGWRGNSLHTNGTDPTQCPECIGIDRFDNGTTYFPWGMQWMYPCGGMPQTDNRTFWPVSGGAIAFQPGWFPGHAKAQLFVNIGIQEFGQLAPPNMSHNVVPPFQIFGPSNDNYSASVCLPQVPMPANVSLQVGQNITLQVVELAQHGAALYSCVDVTLVEDGSEQVQQVNQTNCQNQSVTFGILYSTAETSGAIGRFQNPAGLTILAVVLAFSAVTTLI